MQRHTSHFSGTQAYHWWMGGRTLHHLGLVLFVLVVFTPALALGMEWAGAWASGDTSWASLLSPSGRTAGLLLKSLGFAGAVALGGLVIGVLAASLLWRWRGGLGGMLRWGFLLFAPLPPYIQAVAWDAALGKADVILQSVGLTGIPFQGWLGSWWSQCMAWLPLAAGLALLALETVDPIMIDHARLYQPGLKVFFQIILPLAAPALLAGGGFLFLLSLMDFSVPSYFGLNVYALEIFAEYSAQNSPAHAFILSLPLLLVGVLLLALMQQGLRSAAQTPAVTRPTWAVKPVFTPAFQSLQWGALFLLLLQAAFSAVSLLLATRSFQNLAATLSASRSEIISTFLIGLLAALAGLPAALALACQLLRPGRPGRVAWLLATIPLGFPPALVGIGLISMWNRPVLEAVYSSILMPVAASMARFTPLAAILLQAQLRRMDPALIDAARLLHRGTWRTWASVRLPMLAPGLAAAACLSFTFSIGELGATLLVTPPGLNTLTLRIYNYLHYGATDQVAGLCLMMSLMVLAAALPAALTLLGWNRLLSPGRRSKP